MNVKVLNSKDLGTIPHANIVDFIIEGIKSLEKLITLNELNENIALLWVTPERKIHVHNLIAILNILVNDCKDDPLSGTILIEAEHLLNFLYKLKGTINGNISTNWLLGRQKTKPKEVNDQLNKIILHLEEWKKLFETKLKLDLGNKHVVASYHPKFPNTYEFKPKYLPDDYRSNFFFEVSIKELCPFTTMILFHPYAEAQRGFQEKRLLKDLIKVNINVDFNSFEEIERADNIRGFRLRGIKDDKNYPGSYFILRGGHHRTRAIFQRYLKGEVSGDLKILIQLVTPEDFPDKNLMKNVLNEIKNRDLVRAKF